MGTVAVIGSAAEVAGFRLVGATVLEADGEADVRDAWQRLPDGVAVVVLSAAAARAVPPADGDTAPLWVVMP